MNITAQTERRVVMLDSQTSIWYIHSLFRGAVIAAEGFMIARETDKAIYFKEDQNGTSQNRKSER